MNIKSKILLLAGFACLVASFVGVTRDLGGGILLPVGAVLLMGGFIHHLVAREIVLYDLEQQKKLSRLTAPPIAPRTSQAPSVTSK